MIVVSAGHTYTHNIHTSKKAIMKQELIVCEKECPASADADAAARSYQKLANCKRFEINALYPNRCNFHKFFTALCSAQFDTR